jgi:hypothetical protein
MKSAMEEKKQSKFKDVKPLNVMLKERKTIMGDCINQVGMRTEGYGPTDNQENYPHGYNNYTMQ